ncbi:ras-related protein Rab-26 isoform X3 [Patagioenas fasciata]|uniref:ras-related protein Rab-26 isoform X3 n=1 Tax=Patagioenas fasciata TaxID=372321 RepID=UPI003A990DE0
MSRKKAARSKGGGAAPSAALPPAAPGPGRAAAAPRGSAPAAPELPRNGGAAAGRPSLSSSGEFYDLAFKVMLVGDSGVGKTCLLVRFKDGAFLAGSFISTVGIDFRNKVLTVDGVKVKLQIWDTAGQERFRSVTHAYYRDAHALLLLYDVTNKASFDNIQEYGVPFMETSAKSGLNVDLAFTAIAKELKHRSMKLPNEPKFKLHDYVKKEVRGSGCCRS